MSRKNKSASSSRSGSRSRSRSRTDSRKTRTSNSRRSSNGASRTRSSNTDGPVRSRTELRRRANGLPSRTDASNIDLNRDNTDALRTETNSSRNRTRPNRTDISDTNSGTTSSTSSNPAARPNTGESTAPAGSATGQKPTAPDNSTISSSSDGPTREKAQKEITTLLGNIFTSDKLPFQDSIDDEQSRDATRQAIDALPPAEQRKMLAYLKGSVDLLSSGAIPNTPKENDAETQELVSSMRDWLSATNADLEQADVDRLLQESTSEDDDPNDSEQPPVQGGLKQFLRNLLNRIRDFFVRLRTGRWPNRNNTAAPAPNPPTDGDPTTTAVAPDRVDRPESLGTGSPLEGSDAAEKEPIPTIDTREKPDKGKEEEDATEDLARLPLQQRDKLERLEQIHERQNELATRSARDKAEREQLSEEERQLVDELYEKWADGNSPVEVLGKFNNNWFDLKKELAFNQANEDALNYQLKLAAMQKLVAFRKETVDRLLDEAKAKVAKDFNLDKADIRSFAPGSTNVTSDYDITFSIPSRPELEVEAIKAFTSLFKQEFPGLTPGILFDTNVYTSGFMTRQPGQESRFLDKLNPQGKTRDLSIAERAVVETGKTMKRQTQMALSMVSMRQTMNDEQWNDFAAQSIADVEQQLRNNGANERDVRDKVDETLDIFAQAARIDLETKEAISNKIKMAQASEDSEGAIDPHTEAAIRDGLYVDMLEQTTEQITALNKNTEALSQAGEGTEARRNLLAERALLISRFEENQGKALIYANEAYFSGGAAVHVVLGMQSGGAVNLGRGQKMQSIIMNTGYQIDHLKHLAAEGNPGRALLNTSKYGNRIANLVLDPNNGIELSQESMDMLHFMQAMVKDVKKNPEAFPTPAAKEAEALARWNTIYPGQDVSQTIQSAFQQIAAKSMAPFIADKVSTQQKELAALIISREQLKRELNQLQPQVFNQSPEEFGQEIKARMDRIERMDREIAYRRHLNTKKDLVQAGLDYRPDSSQASVPSNPRAVINMLQAADAFARAAEDRQTRENRKPDLVGYKTADMDSLLKSIKNKQQAYKQAIETDNIPESDRLTPDEVAAIVIYSSRYFQIFNTTRRSGGQQTLKSNPTNKNWEVPIDVSTDTRITTDEIKLLEKNVDNWNEILSSALTKLNNRPQFQSGGYDPNATVFRFDGKGDYIDKRITDKKWSDKGAISTARELDGALEGAANMQTLNIIDDSVGADIAKFSHFGEGEKEKLLRPDSDFSVLSSLRRPQDKTAKEWVDSWFSDNDTPSTEIDQAVSGLDEPRKEQFIKHLQHIKEGYTETLQKLEESPDGPEKTKKLEQLGNMETIIWNRAVV